jgi:hypothetical protein
MPEEFYSYMPPLIALAVAIPLFFFASTALKPFAQAERLPLQSLILRVFLTGFIFLQIADLTLHHTLEGVYNRLLYKAALSLFLIYACLVSFNFASRIFEQKFGHTKKIDDQVVRVPNYSSRMASLVFMCVLFAIVIYLFIEIWGMHDLMKATGFIGITAAFLILTNSVWFPDLYHGLVLLSSSMAEEGDTIRLPDEDRLYIVNRLSPFFAILLDVDSNQRVISRNSKVFDGPIENMTKRASVGGLRGSITFQLGYPPQTGDKPGHAMLFEQVDRSITEAFEKACERKDIKINRNRPFEWSLVDTGDYALRFVVYYHLDPLPSTKLTRIIRSYIRGTRNDVVRLIYEAASIRGLELATPTLMKLDTMNWTTGGSSVDA